MQLLGFDIIVDMLADRNLSADLLLVKKFGRIIIVGSRGTVQIDPRQAMIKDATIHGFINSNATDNVWICVNDC